MPVIRGRCGGQIYLTAMRSQATVRELAYPA